MAYPCLCPIITLAFAGTAVRWYFLRQSNHDIRGRPAMPCHHDPIQDNARHGINCFQKQRTINCGIQRCTGILTMEKFDEDKDGKLSDEEKAKLHEHMKEMRGKGGNGPKDNTTE